MQGALKSMRREERRMSREREKREVSQRQGRDRSKGSNVKSLMKVVSEITVEWGKNGLIRQKIENTVKSLRLYGKAALEVSMVRRDSQATVARSYCLAWGIVGMCSTLITLPGAC